MDGMEELADNEEMETMDGKMEPIKEYDNTNNPKTGGYLLFGVGGNRNKN